MYTIEAYPDAALLTARRITADRDAWLTNDTPVMSYAIPIGRVVLHPSTRSLVDRLTGELDYLTHPQLSDMQADPRRSPRITGLSNAEARSIVVEPYMAVRSLALAYARRCHPDAQMDFPSDAAFGLHEGSVGGYHTDRCEGETADAPVTLRFATYWGPGGPTRFCMGAQARGEMGAANAVLNGTPEQNSLKVVTFSEGEVACFAGAHGIHASSDQIGARLFVTTSAVVPATRTT